MTPELWAGLAEALAYGAGTHTIGDVVKEIESGDCQLWTAERAAIVTELWFAPRRTIVNFWLAAGDMAPVIALSHHILGWAKTVGCTRAVMTGRRGWERALADEGWTRDAVLLGREIL